MNATENDYTKFKRKVEQYKETLGNTQRYRDHWKNGLKQEIMATLLEAAKAAELVCTVEERRDIDNLEAVILSLGSTHSGLGENVGDHLRRDLVKQNGALLYQQLFNGKIMALINYPYIEKYGQPQPPKQIAIYRPEEFNPPHFIRHLEEFITEMTLWEDYDDDVQAAHPPIGFKQTFEEKPPEP